MLRSVGPRLVALAAAIVLGWAAAGTLSVWPDLSTRLRDDAYYEFAWAANVAAGRGPTISDGVTTSGVQLLWCLVLVPFAWFGGAACLPLVAPWLGLCLHALTSALWLRAVRDRRTGAVLAACWAAHPLLLRECTNGQETALACCCAVLLWRLRAAALPWFALVGCAAVLARTELLALVAALAWPRRALHVPGLALVLHVAGNLALGGGVFADSALPMPWLWHANFAATDPGTGAWLERHWWFLRPVLLGGPWTTVSTFGSAWLAFVLLRPRWPRAWRWVPLLLVAAAACSGAGDLAPAGLAALLLLRWPAPGRRRWPRELPRLALALAAVVVLHWAVRWYPRDYYLAPVVLLPFAAIARAARLRGILVLFAFAQGIDALRYRGEPLLGQLEMELAGRHLGAVLPDPRRVGCFNSGIVTFLQDAAAPSGVRRGVVNLDGVVDRRALDALRARRLGAWLDEQGIDFVLDNAVQFALDPSLPHACGRWFGADFDPARDLVEIARFDVREVAAPRPGADGFRLYWRRGRGRPPAVGGPAWLARDGRGADVIRWPAAAGQVLEVERADGSRGGLATVEVDTQVVLTIPSARRGTGRLFVRGAATPLLVLPPL